MQIHVILLLIAIKLKFKNITYTLSIGSYHNLGQFILDIDCFFVVGSMYYLVHSKAFIEITFS